MQGSWLLQKGISRFIILNLLVAIAYAFGVALSHKFATLPSTVAAIWFPSGMTLALVYLLGNRVILGIVCGSTFAITSSLLERSPPLSVFNLLLVLIACACGNVFQPLIATYSIKKFARQRNVFNYVSTVVVYIAAAIFSPTVSATFGVTSLCLTNIIPWNSYGITWLTWWLASALPHLIFTPPILLWRNIPPTYLRERFWEVAIVMLILLFVIWIAFMSSYPLAYLFLPILIWTVFRYGSFFSSVLVSIVSLIAILSTARGYGLYIKGSPNDSLLLLQSFMAVLSLTSLVLSAVIDERTAAQLSLKQAMESLETQVIERTIALQQSEAQINGFFSSAPIGMGIVDHHLRYIRVNQVLADMNRKSVEYHLGKTLQEVLPDISNTAKIFYHRILETGESILNQEISSRELNENGEEQTWLSSFFPIFDIDNVPFRVGFVVIEISDRKKAEADLKYAEFILREANAELEKLVNIDGLTQIANRRCFNDRLNLEWERLCREQQSLALLLFDIDYFKRYNDCYGHQSGDDCLTAIAQTVKQVLCRPADLIARYGGEEFVVILPNTDLDGAITVAKQISAAIKNLNINHQNSDISDIVTISLGVASLLPSFSQEPSILIKQADVALYKAKQEGRNQSVAYSHIYK